jgi:hypothetical protein
LKRQDEQEAGYLQTHPGMHNFRVPRPEEVVQVKYNLNCGNGPGSRFRACAFADTLRVNEIDEVNPFLAVELDPDPSLDLRRNAVHIFDKSVCANLFGKLPLLHLRAVQQECGILLLRRVLGERIFGIKSSIDML